MRLDTSTEQDALLARATKELLGRSNEALTLRMNPAEAFCLLCQLQLAARHPANGGRSSLIARRIARSIEGWLATTPAAAEVARRGWDPVSDAEVSSGR